MRSCNYLSAIRSRRWEVSGPRLKSTRQLKQRLLSICYETKCIHLPKNSYHSPARPFHECDIGRKISSKNHNILIIKRSCTYDSLGVVLRGHLTALEEQRGSSVRYATKNTHPFMHVRTRMYTKRDVRQTKLTQLRHSRFIVAQGSSLEGYAKVHHYAIPPPRQPYPHHLALFLNEAVAISPEGDM